MELRINRVRINRSQPVINKEISTYSAFNKIILKKSKVKQSNMMYQLTFCSALISLGGHGIPCTLRDISGARHYW